MTGRAAGTLATEMIGLDVAQALRSKPMHFSLLPLVEPGDGEGPDPCAPGAR